MDLDELHTYIQRNCSELDKLLESFNEQEREALTTEILSAPSPEKAADRLSDFLKGSATEKLQHILRDSELTHVLLATISGSRFLFQVLNRNPNHLEKLYIEGSYRTEKNREIYANDLKELFTGVSATSVFDRELRRYKDREYLRIGCRDQSGIAGVREVMHDLSDLAAACIQTTIDFHWARLSLRHGTPSGLDKGIGFAVIALGKLAGRELNFSSDIDLIFIRGPEEGKTDGPDPLPVAGFYESLARSIMHSLSTVTEDGFVFRVDMRLRPEGERGELVPSLSTALEYYWNWGRTWERSAFMKAIPIAGDMAIGEAFVKGLESFVYRKHLDYSTIEEMREMKLAIEAQLKRKPGINIKLGQGGIREIEFFVQALQLINAGKNPAIRTPSTLKALELLEKADLLDDETATELTAAYLFFRKTEHRIQINHQVQTHELPRTIEDQTELARKMGYTNDALGSFMKFLDARRKYVEELFSGMFYSSADEEIQDISPAAREIVQSIHDEDIATKLLFKHGFADPADSYKLLKGLIVPAERRIYWDKGRNMLERLAPLFVEELMKAPEPDKCLLALDRYISSLHASASYFSTLLQNPPTARFLVKILGESRFFAELLIRHPQSIDSLIGRWSAQYPLGKSALTKGLAERLAYCETYEQQLDSLRIFKNEQILRIGARHLSGELDSPTARHLVTRLAEVCLDAAVRIATSEMERKFGPCDFTDALPFVIIGMGKLGGSEMSYLSDLDVIFVYDAPQQTICGLTAHEWFTRLAQRIMSTLSVHTAEGVAFEIDARLRPSGQKGPLVSSLPAFRDYHETTSKIWEKQALIKARPVTGPEILKQDVQNIVHECVLRTELSEDGLAEIAGLRERMENELAQEDKKHVDLKTGRGGMIDVEFFVQATILQHVHNHPEILTQNTLEALSALQNAALIDSDTFETLDGGYRFLIGLEDRLRIMEHRSVNRLPLEGEKLVGVARRLGYREGKEQLLVEEYFKTTRSIRAIYKSLLKQQE